MRITRIISGLFIVAVLAFAFTGVNAQKAKDPKPKITLKQAKRAAVVSLEFTHPDAKIKVKEGELEMEEGKRVYSIDVLVDQQMNEVWVDPMSGDVIKTIVETKQQEAAEAAADKAKKKAKRAAK